MPEEYLWGAIARGKVHFQLEVWQASTSDEFHEMLANNHLTDLGTYSAKSREEWWYPNHVEKLCPGLPDWKALNRCAALFAKDGSKKGEYITGPWPYRDPNLIRGLKLDFIITRYKNYDKIWKKLAAAQQQNQAIVLLNWTPNWTDQRVGGKFVEFPAFAPECETDPQWGVNKKLTFDCGNVQNGWIKKAGWPQLESRFPCVHQLLSQLDLDNQMIAEASAIVDYDKFSEDQAANIWLNKYKSNVDTWVSNSCMSS
jgi:glycine betaine/proline transport system substrate-binding protein